MDNACLIDEYIGNILTPEELNGDLVYVDYIAGGTTWRMIHESLKRLTGNPGLLLPGINVLEGQTIDELLACLITSCENIEARHVPRFVLEYTVESIDMRRSNIIVSYIYMVARGIFNDTYMNAYPEQYDKDTIYIIEYYDIKTHDITAIYATLNRQSDMINCLLLTGQSINVNQECLVYVKAIAPTHPHIQVDPKVGYLQAELVDGRKVTGYYDGVKLVDGDNFLNEYNYRFFKNTVFLPLLTEYEGTPLTTGQLYNVEYYCNGTIKKEKIFIKNVLYDQLQFIKSEDFVLNRRPQVTHMMSQHLIHTAELVPYTYTQINEEGTLSYTDDKGHIYHRMDKWLTNDYFYHNRDYTVSVLCTQLTNFL
jgi:hypothetical protein